MGGALNSRLWTSLAMFAADFKEAYVHYGAKPTPELLELGE